MWITKEKGPGSYWTFPISRDPPEGGTRRGMASGCWRTGTTFPISRDPPEGGTTDLSTYSYAQTSFQFLGIPPKGEPVGCG